MKCNYMIYFYDNYMNYRNLRYKLNRIGSSILPSGKTPFFELLIQKYRSENEESQLLVTINRLITPISPSVNNVGIRAVLVPFGFASAATFRYAETTYPGYAISLRSVVILRSADS